MVRATVFLFCMVVPPPRSTLTATLFPYTTLFRSPPRRQTRDVTLDRETFLFEQGGQIPFGLMFLEADLGKAEQFVIDDLRQLRACFDAADHLGLRSTRHGLRGGGDSKRDRKSTRLNSSH